MFKKKNYLIFLSLFFIHTDCLSPEDGTEQGNQEHGFIEDLYFCFKEYCIPKKHPLMISQESNPIKNIIFDLNEVLFITSKQTYIRKAPAFLWYEFSRLFQGRLPNFKIKQFFDDTLRDIPSEFPDNVAYHNGQPLLPIMNDWQCGRDVYQVVIDHIDAQDMPKTDKQFLKTVASTFFVPEQFAESKKPIDHVVQMLTDLKDAGYKLYVLSNWDKQSFPLFKKIHSNIMDLFDGIMISGDEGLVKPDERFFEACLKKFDLKAEECLFIDDQEINVDGALKVGMKAFTFHYKDKKSIMDKMKEYNIIE